MKTFTALMAIVKDQRVRDTERGTEGCRAWLKRGWCSYQAGIHHVLEASWQDCHAQMQHVAKCDCSLCREGAK